MSRLCGKWLQTEENPIKEDNKGLRRSTGSQSFIRIGLFGNVSTGTIHTHEIIMKGDRIEVKAPGIRIHF